ncbi:hypothetical protein Cma02nite_25080 [Cellulomonas marina]|uniref:Glycosyltransferase involved in cell wall bisynthesis n=2 Tax=Cellulomonas marina TaxID=988821 RepID=A0A1I0UYZ3_9CELL|nr:hypothetical protein Cma02nite_25080 [Cellulomonas marina]SFA69261.1 Glycosyltransferase involved in cell wall bisynthesis [Cellulomonas marina]
MTVEQCWQRVPGGSATYLVELAAALSARDDVRVTGLRAAHRPGSRPDPEPPVPVRSAALPRVALYEAWNRTRLPRAEWAVPGADVVHATTWAVPGTRRPLVVTVHDLAFLRDPALFTPRGVRFFTDALARVRDEAAVVLVPSQATADDCAAHGIEPARVVVVPHGAPGWTVTSADVARVRARYGLPERYVLWCGTHEPRKNLPGLLRAWELLAPQEPDLHLVLVGPRGWGDDGAAAGADLPRVHAPGRLPAGDLPAAYAAAEAFCFPSTWEGFGLPVLEAMSTGTPVVTSAGTAMAEVVGDHAGLLVDPLDPAAVAAAVQDAVGPRHEVLSGAARRRAQGYSWTATAATTRAAYATAAGRTGIA